MTVGDFLAQFENIPRGLEICFTDGWADLLDIEVFRSSKNQCVIYFDTRREYN